MKAEHILKSIEQKYTFNLFLLFLYLFLFVILLTPTVKTGL